MEFEIMDIDEIEEILGKELSDTGWRFKHWKRDDTIEFRNTAADLPEEKKDELINDFLADLDEDNYRSFLSGKLCLEKRDGKIIKKNIDGEGKPQEEGQILTEEEAKDLLRKSIERIDSDLIPTNRAMIDREEIVDIFSERVRGLKLITINMKGNKIITLTDKGGLQFETQ